MALHHPQIAPWPTHYLQLADWEKMTWREKHDFEFAHFFYGVRGIEIIARWTFIEMIADRAIGQRKEDKKTTVNLTKRGNMPQAEIQARSIQHTPADEQNIYELSHSTNVAQYLQRAIDMHVKVEGRTHEHCKISYHQMLDLDDCMVISVYR